MKKLLVVENLVQEFKSRPGILNLLKRRDGRPIKEQKIVHAVNGVSFTIYAGETFGLVGESGCGKSTTARSIIRLLDPASGRVLYRGQDVSRLKGVQLRPYRKNVQMIFQDPQSSLDPRQQIRDIIMEPMLFHKVCSDHKDAEARCMTLLEKVGLRPEQARRYPHQFSGGQRQRVGIARALAVEPEFIIADEPVSALDVSIQAQILNLMMDLKDEFKFSYLFIAHDLSVVRYICDRIAVMYLGAIMEMGTKADVFENPIHPYTRLLFSAVPTIGEAPLVDQMEMTGEIPSPIHLPEGCFFNERCPYAAEECRHCRPELKEIESNHFVACHRCK